MIDALVSWRALFNLLLRRNTAKVADLNLYISRVALIDSPPIDGIKNSSKMTSVQEQTTDEELTSSLISVVIPTYYRPLDLSELFDSLLRQFVRPLEVIVVDDTPTAAIRHICEDYGQRFYEFGVTLTYLRNPSERSMTASRNLGVRMAKGEIIQFFDSDVVIDPDYLREVQKTFEEHPEALGVAGWAVWRSPILTGVRNHALQTLQRLFLLFHYARNSCKHFEIPVVLNKEIHCEWLSGANTAYRRSAVRRFQFDENLTGYSFMEDVLFSGLINKICPGQLIMTPNAKCYHNESREGRMEKSELRLHKLRCRKYVLTKLFGYRGLLVFGWQNLGLLVLRLISEIRKSENLSKEV